MGDTRKVLIVYAHQEPKSFNGALKDVAIETLRGQGHDVVISDLYEMNFNPVASKSTFKEIKNPEYFNFQEELKHAAITGSLPGDIKTEIYGGMPAILKGWIDRCLADHVAFNTDENKWFDHGPFFNKKIMLSMTMGGSRGYFSNKGVFGDINALLWPMQNSVRTTGAQILAPQISYMMDSTQENRVAILESWKSRLLNVWSEKPLSFIHIDKFNPDNEFQLKESYISDVLSKTKTAPTVGQHLGRTIHPGSMLEGGLDLENN